MDKYEKLFRKVSSVALKFKRMSLFYEAKNISLSRIIDIKDTQRINIYRAGFKRIAASPILGSGADISSIEPYNDIGFHNDYIILWSIGGILSLLLYLLFPPFLLPGLTNIPIIIKSIQSL